MASIQTSDAQKKALSEINDGIKQLRQFDTVLGKSFKGEVVIAFRQGRGPASNFYVAPRTDREMSTLLSIAERQRGLIAKELEKKIRKMSDVAFDDDEIQILRNAGIKIDSEKNEPSAAPVVAETEGPHEDAAVYAETEASEDSADIDSTSAPDRNNTAPEHTDKAPYPPVQGRGTMSGFSPDELEDEAL